jgi:hypothetical protein
MSLPYGAGHLWSLIRRSTEKLLRPGNTISQPPIPFAWLLFLKTESSAQNAVGNPVRIITRIRIIPIIIRIPTITPIPIIIRIDTTILTATPTAVTGGNATRLRLSPA